MKVSQGWEETFVVSGHKCSLGNCVLRYSTSWFRSVVHLLAFPLLTHMDMGNVLKA